MSGARGVFVYFGEPPPPKEVNGALGGGRRGGCFILYTDLPRERWFW